MSKQRAFRFNTANVSCMKRFLLENGSDFLFLDKRGSLVQVISRSTCFWIFKFSFVVNFLIVKPERVAPSKMWFFKRYLYNSIF